MRIIEKSHIPWAIGSIGLLVACGLYYRGYALEAANGPAGGPRGSTWPGLIYGILAAIFMAFTGALGIRRRFRSWRLGSGRLWLRGHLWLGFIALPLIWMHAGHLGFKSGGMLTIVIMYLMYAVWITGVYGILLQQVMPTHLKNKIPNETLLSQIAGAIESMRIEAKKVAGTNGAVFDFYQKTVLPLLGAPAPSAVVMSGTGKLTATSFDSSGSATVEKLEQICGEYKNLLAEKRLLWWLHSWLLIHVPLSMALLLLSAIHIIMALRYTI